MNKNINLGLFIFRASTGILMLLHGLAKIKKGVSFIAGKLAEVGLPEFIAYGVYLGEIVFPLMMILGLRTRLAALGFAINCLFAIFLSHANDIFVITPYGGWGIELLGLYLFGALGLFFTGGGAYGLSSRNKWD